MGEMIRFKADTWIEALFRFFAMAAPDGNVYVEIAAPDLRFAAVVLLAFAVLACRKRLAAEPRPLLALLAGLLVCTPPWLMTTGNGRYFLPMLLFVGPLAIGLIYLLPLTKWFRAFLAAALVSMQTFVVMQSSPWDAWAWLAWRDAPYFQVDQPAAPAGAPPTTYVTLTSISYSLIAPQFPAATRWINITSVRQENRDGRWASDFLESAPGALKLLVPSIRGTDTPDGLPGEKVLKALDELLAPQRLALDPASPCTLLKSRGIAAIGSSRKADLGRESRDGFWICPLRYPVGDGTVNAKAAPARTEAVFARVEEMCPRFFTPGSAKTTIINGGALRHYSGSDMKVYVLDDGQVLYKFWRALNPVSIGTVDGIMAGQQSTRCDQIKGRSGLPWEREI